LISSINTLLSVARDIDYFNRIIDGNTQDASAYYFRALAHLALGDAESAYLDTQESLRLGLRAQEVLTANAYARIKSSKSEETHEGYRELATLLDKNPDDALVNLYIGDFFTQRRTYKRALEFLETALELDSNLVLAHVLKSQIYVSLGREQDARDAVDLSVGLELPSASNYVDRARVYTVLGDIELAFSDFDEAIRINPNQAKYYNARAKGYASRGDFEPALADFNSAIRRNPAEEQYYVNRGIVYSILGDAVRSSTDFETALSISQIEIPEPKDHIPSYFSD